MRVLNFNKIFNPDQPEINENFYTSTQINSKISNFIR